MSQQQHINGGMIKYLLTELIRARQEKHLALGHDAMTSSQILSRPALPLIQ